MKQKIKIIIDIFMTLLLFLLNGYQFFSQSMHEWFGMMMFVCFILHNALNFNWYKNLIKGYYSTVRKIYLIINILVFVSMMIQMYSGITMSRHVFQFLNTHTNMSFVRKLHILGAYWGFLFIGLHLGIHWNILIKRIFGNKVKYTKVMSKLIRIMSFIIAIYGIYELMKRNFLTYLFLQSEFVFMDFNEMPLFFYIDYIAIMGLCIFIANHGLKLLMDKKRMIGNKEKS